MLLRIDVHSEADGRYFGVAVGLPGVMAYGATKAEAVGTTLQLALEVLEDMAEHGEAPVTTTFAVELAPAAAA